MSSNERIEETLGILDSRLLKLENKGVWEKWEQHFGKHPFIVVGGVIVAMVSGAWIYHTWTIERLDKQHRDELAAIEKRADDKVNWLKEQHKLFIISNNDKCDFEKSKIASNFETCKPKKGKNITHRQ